MFASIAKRTAAKGLQTALGLSAPRASWTQVSMAAPALQRVLAGLTLNSSRALSSGASDSQALSAAAVKKLREHTGAPMMECKKALAALLADPNITDKSEASLMQHAVEYLRRRGTVLAQKNAGRSAKEGVVVVAVDKNSKKGAMVEVNCETDFVSRNSTFLKFALRSALASLDNIGEIEGSVDNTSNASEMNIDVLANSQIANGSNSISTELIDVITNTRENVKLRRGSIVSLPPDTQGFIASYVHNEIPIPDEIKGVVEAAEKQGRSVYAGGAGCLAAVAVEDASKVDDELEALGRKIAMQAVAARPQYLHRENVPKEIIDKELSIVTAQTDLSSKSEKARAAILNGKLEKFYEEFVLVDQLFLVTNESKKPKVSQLLAQHPAKPKIIKFARLQRGEGAEVAEAAEAEAQATSNQ